MTAVFNAITVTAPTGGGEPGAGLQLSAGDLERRTRAVGSGQFSLWVVRPGNGWYVGKIVNADGTASYSNSVTLNVPVDTGYRVYVYYRATTGNPWGVYGMSPGTVNVTAPWRGFRAELGSRQRAAGECPPPGLGRRDGRHPGFGKASGPLPAICSLPCAGASIWIGVTRGAGPSCSTDPRGTRRAVRADYARRSGGERRAVALPKRAVVWLSERGALS